jgi:hypothetical protein
MSEGKAIEELEAELARDEQRLRIELLKSPYAFGTWPKNRLFSELALIDLFRSDPCLWQVAVKPASRTSDRLHGQPFSSLWKKP